MRLLHLVQDALIFFSLLLLTSYEHISQVSFVFCSNKSQNVFSKFVWKYHSQNILPLATGWECFLAMLQFGVQLGTCFFPVLPFAHLDQSFSCGPSQSLSSCLELDPFLSWGSSNLELVYTWKLERSLPKSHFPKKCWNDLWYPPIPWTWGLPVPNYL